ncbi:hypothetical protein [Sinirhodobacter huangdaonensis]|uniref:Uncharacterized protein n=1 Tax=Paenirhodobacter huangdaonensis TaxID=2501515 RepID=A0A443LVH9_9RHOB|nr:hypothetical protein [Sinirhodobacter huangdaonensis]RWR53197.1 hypothetical protein EOW66_05660 [Sinirhodobacter huangdaonensis]
MRRIGPALIAAISMRTARAAAQTLGTSTQRDQAIRAASAGRDVVQSADANAVRAGSLGRVVVKGNSPPWLILAFAVAPLLDSPLRWPEQIWRAVRGRKDQRVTGLLP